MLGLGIETSCDETSIAVTHNGSKILCNLILSQHKEHHPFQGVVPELASRAHLENINLLFELALAEANIELNDLDYIAVSKHPGLVGSLMMGANFSKCLSLVTGLPIYPVNHIEAHFYAPCLEGLDIKNSMPVLGLILSGGNSAIYRLDNIGDMQLLIDTSDDACGEAYDKVAKLLDLGYPGGPLVEQYATEYIHNSSIQNIFPSLIAKKNSKLFSFSFSGIKTAVLRAWQTRKYTKQHICYDFQERCLELIVHQIQAACTKTGIHRMIAGGGVLANQKLRQTLNQLTTKHSLDIIYPKDRTLCTDNAAMIAGLGYYLHTTEHAKTYQGNLEFSVDAKS